MKNSFNDSQLEIMATQVASLRANESIKSAPARAISRFRRDFLQKGVREKLRFAKYAVRESLTRLSAWMRRKQQPAVHVDVPPDRLLVLARCNGGLGDLVIYGALLDRFFKECGRPVIHVFVHTLRLTEARFAFHNSPAVAEVTDVADFDPATTPYDVIITLGDFLSYDYIRRERVERIAPAVLEKLTAARQVQQPYQPFIAVQPQLDGLFAGVASKAGLRRLDVLGWLGKLQFTQQHQLLASPDVDSYRRFEALGLAAQPYITLHNGWDNVAHRNTENATKGWPVSHYEQFVAGFKRRFPEVLVVQLGAKTSRPIAGIDLSLLEDTTLHEAAWILKHSLLHVDADSGLVHLARALHTKSLVLFGPTNHEFFRYAQNENCFSTVCGNCWWSTPDWMRTCPRGLAEPVCMASIDPEDVLLRAERHLRSLPSMHLKIEDACREDSQAGDEWRSSLVRDWLADSEPAGDQLRVAVVDRAGLAPTLLTDGDRKIRTFSFQEDGLGDYERDGGSYYNIPAESGAFDVVITPLLTDKVRFPFALIKESLRIVRENGRVMLTYRFADDGHAFIQALRDLGMDERPLSSSGGIVLRKVHDGNIFAERNSRASETVGV